MALKAPKLLPNGAPRSAVILLHGLGADGANLLDIGNVLSENFPNTAFYSPNAPFDFDMMPGAGYQWFSLTNWSPKSMLEGAKTAAPYLNKMIDDVKEELGLEDNKIALIGFSQGTMMALYTALRRPQKVAGIVGFSGALIAPELVAVEAVSKPDICLIHGAMDMVVPYAALHMAETSLKAAGLKVETHTRPYLDHSIDMEGINAAGKFLAARL